MLRTALFMMSILALPKSPAEMLSTISCIGTITEPERTITTAFFDIRATDDSSYLQFALIFDSAVNGRVDQLNSPTDIINFSPLMRPTSSDGNLVIYRSRRFTAPLERQARDERSTQQIFRPVNAIQTELGEARKTLREIFQNTLQQHRYNPEAAVECGGNETVSSRGYRQKYRVSYSISEEEETRRVAEISMDCASYNVEKQKLAGFIFCTHMRSYANQEPANTGSEQLNLEAAPNK